ncbi:LuxR C-terminal-related transcriptional regulator [Kitasatospora sp. NPDC004669]|uniref:LuxR C-terminal-related transcriptional regulator n=1 Tax=Kitasatospora sp. NPDC004669 TaxID=3154555 RepID=UPI0033B5C74B
MTTPPTRDPDPLRRLTPREAQALAHLTAGHDIHHTAAAFGVTPTTARNHLHRALRKLGCPTEAAAIALLGTAPPIGTRTRVAPAASGEHGGTTSTPSATRAPTTGAPDGSERHHRPPVVGTERGKEGGDGPGTAAPEAPPEQGGRRGSAAASEPAAGSAATGPGDAARPRTVVKAPELSAHEARTATRAAKERRAGTRAAATGGVAQEAPSAGEVTRPGAGRAVASPGQTATGRQGAAGQRKTPTPHADPRKPGSPAPGRVTSGGQGAASRRNTPTAPTANAADDQDLTSRRGPATAPPQERSAGAHDRAANASEGTASRHSPPTAPTEPGASAPRGHAPTTPGSRRDLPTAPVPERTGAAPGRAETDGPTPPRQRPTALAEAARDEQLPAARRGLPAAPADARKHGGAATGRSAGAEQQPVPRQDAPSLSGRRERIDMALTEAGSGRDLSDEPVPSFDDLYAEAHTRLVQQVFLLTACRHRAVHCVRRAFGQARREWDAVVGSGDPEGWVRVRACESALSPWHRGGPRWAHAWSLPHRRIKVRPADEAQAVLPDHDRLTDRDQALLKALRRLPRPQRRALVLHDGLGLPAAAIAVEVESTRAAAEGRVWAARAALAQWVPELVGPDPAAPGFADGLSGLLHGAAVRGCPEPHRSPVPVLRARHRLWTASRTGAAALLTVAVGGATLATLAGLRPAVLFQPSDPPSPAVCVPAADAKVKPPGVPLLPGGAPNGVSSLWCSPAPGLEAVVVGRQAVAGWKLPAASGVQAPPERQGPAACLLWSPRPCTTGPRH